MFYTINILPDGTVFPCANIEPPYILGNVKEGTLKEYWNSKKRKEFLIHQFNMWYNVARSILAMVMIAFL